jgi:hypothetical protein
MTRSVALLEPRAVLGLYVVAASGALRDRAPAACEAPSHSKLRCDLSSTM